MQVTSEGLSIAIGITGTEVAIFVAQSATQGEFAHFVTPRGIGGAHMHVVLKAGVGIKTVSPVIVHPVMAVVQAQDILAAYFQQVVAPQGQLVVQLPGVLDKALLAPLVVTGVVKRRIDQVGQCVELLLVLACR